MPCVLRRLLRCWFAVLRRLGRHGWSEEDLGPAGGSPHGGERWRGHRPQQQRWGDGLGVEGAGSRVGGSVPGTGRLSGLSDGAAAAGWAPRGAPVGDPDLELPPRKPAVLPGPCRPHRAGPVEPGMRTQPPWGRGAASLAGRDRLSAPSPGAWGPRRPTVLLPPPPLPSASHLAPQTRSRFSVLLRRNENSPRFLGISSVEKLTGELPSWLSRDESEEHP